MDRDKLIQRLRATFSGELREHVESFNRELLSLERGGNDAARAESIKTLFRTAHSLKGAARAVNATKLERVCHHLEELLQGLRDGSRQLTPEVFDTLFSAVDTFEEASREINASLPAPSSPPVVPAIGTPIPPKARTPAPPSAAKSQPQAQAEPPARAQAIPPIASSGAPSSDRLTPAPSERAAPTAFSASPIDASAPVPANAAPSLAPSEFGRPPVLPPTATASDPLANATTDPPKHTTPPRWELPAVSLPATAAGADVPANAGNLETFLRVPEHKLDALLAGNSELLIARRRLDARYTELTTLTEHVAELRVDAERSARGKLRSRSNKLIFGNAAVRLQTHAATRAVDPQREVLLGLERAVESFAASLAEDLRALDRAAQALDERIHQVRMLPFQQACDALPRTVRDLAARERKPTELILDGGEIELDRSIVDGLRAPLLHLVRNAVDHGIESADERSTAGKPPRAKLTITAALRGDRVEVRVRDDGRGIDLEKIRERLRQSGIAAPADDQDTLRMIFEAGFSTAPSVTDVSGRGVGLDVVRAQVEGMRGSVGVSFEPGKGTCFSLQLPLTVTTLRALLVRSGGEMYALPSANIEKLVRAGATELASLQGRETLLTEGAPLPLVSLAEIVGAEAAQPTAAQGKLPVVILGQPGERVAIAVDELIAEQDVVVKPLGKRVRRLRHVSGATLLPDGRVALLLHAGEILRTALGRTPARRAGGMFLTSTQPARKRLLLIDDSATTRTLEKSILEAAGFEVLTAVDGAQGWQLLQEHGADLIVSDVEMPNMSGFELVQTVRNTKRFRELPVILLTSLDSEQDRVRGLESGADAYLVKSAFDQSNLIDTIRQLL